MMPALVMQACTLRARKAKQAQTTISATVVVQSPVSAGSSAGKTAGVTARDVGSWTDPRELKCEHQARAPIAPAHTVLALTRSAHI